MRHGNRQGRHGKARAKIGAKTAAAASAVGMEPLGVAPNIAFGLIGVGVTKGYELIATGELRSYRIGRARRITMDSIRALIAEKLAQAEAPKA
jgi:excisionase family DNA binding protein